MRSVNGKRGGEWLARAVKMAALRTFCGGGGSGGDGGIE